MRKAICLLSGGMDSAVCLYVARSEGYKPIALSIHYGQRHDREVSAAKAIARVLRVKHYCTSFFLPWKGSSLLDENQRIPRHHDVAQISKKIPNTYVPARNSVFLSLAMSCAETENAKAIFIGVNAVDYSGYPDCRPDYLKAFAEAIRLGTKTRVQGETIEIKAPLVHLSKKEIVLLGKKLGVPFERTWSCYQGGEKPCGTCDSCLLRAKGFHDAGWADPLLS